MAQRPCHACGVTDELPRHKVQVRGGGERLYHRDAEHCQPASDPDGDRDRRYAQLEDAMRQTGMPVDADTMTINGTPEA